MSNEIKSMKKAIAVGAAMQAVALVASAAGIQDAKWISVPSAPMFKGVTGVGSRAADGTSWFVRKFANRECVKSARWTVSGLGVFDVYVNGRRVGDDFLKPGNTHWKKTKYAFSYDVTGLLDAAAGAENFLAAEVSAGWWRDKVIAPNRRSSFPGIKSAFLGALDIEYKDGSHETVVTEPDGWKCGTAGAVTHAAIFDGEEYDARIANPMRGEGLSETPDINTEFPGEVLPTDGGEVVLRRDLAMVRGPYEVKKGETLVVDFGQNCAAVPEFKFRARRGTVLTFLPGEMLNDSDKGIRGCDGPKGSVYRANLRIPDAGMRAVYVFSGDGTETYLPRFTYFGYRYAAVSATDDVAIESIASIPVTSVTKEMETGSFETGDAAVNRFVKNVYWGQLSNYVSIPTDCPQRNERQGWLGDAQIFCEAGSFNADVRSFFRKWMRDMRDTQSPEGGFQGFAPFPSDGYVQNAIGWADAGVIVPYTVWRQYGDASIVDANWNAMERFVGRIAQAKYRTAELPETYNYQYGDWLSLTKLDSATDDPALYAFDRLPNGKRTPKPDAQLYWNYLGGCYWLWDSQMMAQMAEATGRGADADKYRRMADEARAYMRREFFSSPDGMVSQVLRGMQTPALFALKMGLVEGDARERTIADLKASFAKCGGRFHTGFLGTSILLDTLSENGMHDIACDLMLGHDFPGWLYSVDQGATTVWERWNSYTKEKGFGPVDMNSFNHYAYGSVLAWMYRHLAGISSESSSPGFRRIAMAPKPDRRLGHVKVEYRSAAGLVKSFWRYDGDKWTWEFTVPEGSVADVTLPGETVSREYASGSHRVNAVLRGEWR